MSSRPLTLTKIVKATSRPRQEPVEADAAADANDTSATSAGDAVAVDEDAAQLHAEGGRRRKVKRYHNHDIPGYPASLKKFRDLLIPRWYFYVATLVDPWDLGHPDHVNLAQALWNKFIKIDHIVALHDEPVFALVSQDDIPFVTFNHVIVA